MEIRLAIIDDNPDFIAAFCDYTEQVLGFSRPIGYQDPKSALRAMERHIFDVVLVDLLLGRSSGCELIRDIKAKHPKTHIVVLSGHSEDNLIATALAYGAEGYLLKSQPIRDILKALEGYVAGGLAMDTDVMKKIIGQFRDKQNHDKSIETLTKKERIILGLLASGKSYKEIADEMKRSPQTIYSHSKRMYRKLGVKSKTEAAVLYLQGERPPGAAPDTEILKKA
jgi:DNA-binding NarL/FixJ family response regulator